MAKRLTFVIASLVLIGFVILTVVTLKFKSKPSETSVPLGRENPTEGVGVQEQLGNTINLETPFTDEEGQVIALQDYVNKGRPLVVMMGYFECPKLCSLVLNGYFSAARSLTWNLGQEYDFVIVSIDPKENHVLAANKKVNYVRYYGRTGSEKGIHFLTGSEENIHKLAKELGFQYKYDEKAKQYIHPAVLTVLSTKGKITRYLYGIDFKANDVKLALIESAENRVGTIVERLLLLCYQFDPQAGSYSFTIMTMLKFAAACTVLMMGFLIWFLRRQGTRAI